MPRFQSGSQRASIEGVVAAACGQQRAYMCQIERPTCQYPREESAQAAPLEGAAVPPAPKENAVAGGEAGFPGLSYLQRSRAL